MLLSFIQVHYPTIRLYEISSISALSVNLSIFDESNLLLKDSRVKDYLNVKGMKSKQHILKLVMNKDLHTNYFTRNYEIDHPLLYESTHLPLIPDVVISIRCNDILSHGRGSPYGFLNFNVYTMIIPYQVKTIYVLTEPSTYNSNHNKERCEDIVLALLLFLDMHYPDAVISLIRGHQFHAMVMIKEAKLVICTATTFCLWPGLLNQSLIYFPITWLVSEGRGHMLTRSWRWISYPILHQFQYQDQDQNSTVFENILNTLLSYPRIPSEMKAIGT